MWLTLTMVAAIAMLGEFTPVGKLTLSILPRTLQSFVYPEEVLALFTMGMAVLAGLGAQRYRRGVLGFVLLAATATDLIAVSSSRVLNTANTRDDPGVSYEQFHGSRSVLDRLRALINQTIPAARVDTVDDSLDWASSAPLLEIPTANGNDSFALIRYMQVRLSLVDHGARWGRYYQVSVPQSPVLSLLDVRYLLSRTPVSNSFVTRIDDVPGGAVYENPRVLPRFFLVNGIQRVADMEQGLAVLRSDRFRPGEFAIVEGAPPFKDQDRARAPNPPVRVVRYMPRQLVLETEADHATYLVTSEADYPGWRAYVDGHRQGILPTNVAFRGLPVPAGRHQIEMRFSPSIRWRAAGISAIAGCGFIWLVASAIMVRKRSWIS
jgi:hypothetical protein